MEIGLAGWFFWVLDGGGGRVKGICKLTSCKPYRGTLQPGVHWEVSRREASPMAHPSAYQQIVTSWHKLNDQTVQLVQKTPSVEGRPGFADIHFVKLFGVPVGIRTYHKHIHPNGDPNGRPVGGSSLACKLEVKSERGIPVGMISSY